MDARAFRPGVVEVCPQHSSQLSGLLLWAHRLVHKTLEAVWWTDPHPEWDWWCHLPYPQSFPFSRRQAGYLPTGLSLECVPICRN